MYKEPDAMREIHKIREKIYEEEKGLSLEEKMAKIKKEADEVTKKYGVKFNRHYSNIHS